MNQTQKIRKYELDLASSYFPVGADILEIGAGTGWQAKLLVERGFSVEAIDIEGSSDVENSVFPVRYYDGIYFPYKDSSFDVVFSSNVLEHIPHVEVLQSEIRRVLRPGGTVVHVLPTGSWRLWSNFTHYINVCKIAFFILFPRRRTDLVARQLKNSRKYNYAQLFSLMAIPRKHGVISSNTVSEIYYFSRFYWLRLFRKTGWDVVYFPNRLFYTSSSIFDTLLGIKVRRFLSYLLGSACLLYVMKDNLHRKKMDDTLKDL